MTGAFSRLRVLVLPPLASGTRRRGRSERGPVLTGARIDDRGGMLSALSSALVTLHKEQFGRGPTRARSNFAGGDTLVCVLEEALLPAERMMVEMDDQQRVREARVALQAATSDKFIEAVESIVRRK